jgi:hypothetical protein
MWECSGRAARDTAAQRSGSFEPRTAEEGPMAKKTGKKKDKKGKKDKKRQAAPLA